MGKTLDCGHPVECLRNVYDDWFCGWCDEVAGVRRDNEALTAQLHKRAVILRPGKHELRVESIGYLVCETGVVVNIEQPSGNPAAEIKTVAR